MGCCCGGGQCISVKREKGEEESGTLCRDVYLKHSIRTKACEALSNLPFSISLYSGIHGEAVVSSQPRWLAHASDSDSNSSTELFGTRVLIPVLGGLIELFAAKHIPKDQKIIKLVTSNCRAPLREEPMTAQSISDMILNEHSLVPLIGDSPMNLQPSCHLLPFIPPIHVVPPLTLSNTHPSLEGSSSSSNPSNEHPLFSSYSDHLLQSEYFKQLVGQSSGSRKYKYSEKQEAGLRSDQNKKTTKFKQRSESQDYRSKNLLSERKRRNRINGRMLALRALVPNISKMDKTATLGDAIEYIIQLEKEIKKLEDELNETEEDTKKSNPELTSSQLDALRQNSRHLPPTKNNRNSSAWAEKKKTEVALELNQIGKRDFLVKFFCEKKKGGFGRLMGDLNALGIHVVDANITTSNGKVLNILKVEANKDIQLKKLRESLVEFARRINNSDKV